MLVNFVSFYVDAPDLEAFDRWYIGLVEDAQKEPGCMVYEYMRDPRDARHCFMLAAWENEADIAAHRLHPSHVELLAFGSTRWGIRDLHRHSWADVGGHTASGRPRIDGSDLDGESRATMHALVSRLQREQGHEPSTPTTTPTTTAEHVR